MQCTANRDECKVVSILRSSIMSPAASFSSIAGDHIGVESCVDMVKTKDDVVYCNMSERVGCCSRREEMRRKQQKQKQKQKKKEYPPPIPLLARTGNLHSHMPWVLKRYYTPDGRLILREEKVRHHEYLQAHRADGRLTLNLVAMDHNVSFMIPNNTNGSDDDTEVMQQQQIVDADDGCGDGVVKMVKKDGKCLGYSFNINSSSSGSVGSAGGCIFGIGVPISHIRPVRG